MTNIVGYLPEASKLAPFLCDASGFENIFEEEEPDLFRIDAEEEGLCMFAYENENDHILCSLHSVALHLNVPPHKVKPRSCVTWPLAITDDPPLLLSIADDAFSFPCNTSRKSISLSLDPEIAQIIRDMFGEKFFMRVEEARKIVPTCRSAIGLKFPKESYT
ncbi:MAG: hypothetical protein JSU99_04775 [Nitrospiraceae bacterium]|nr:MAG: hypothetical protein JSU99_04775 [Nitrospiraceae bacterium]